MEDMEKTKEQLLAELVELRQRVKDIKAEEERSQGQPGESEARFRGIFENSPDIVALTDPKGGGHWKRVH